ncbi:iron chelate uptake ABC transporter family permease subunit [Streptomyces sp. NPDC096311]|uniref:iron chelate uptake ABC transporter family permease subunit n=1 Tax=Streptomyces sp. NPDC096311 TaxID=3366083 RepID=UPI0038153669
MSSNPARRVPHRSRPRHPEGTPKGTAKGLTVLGAVLAAVATGAAGAAGPVGFVALTGPRLARRLTRTPQLPLAASALTGALIVVGADLVARTLVPPLEIPVGAAHVPGGRSLSAVAAGQVGPPLTGSPYLRWKHRGRLPVVRPVGALRTPSATRWWRCRSRSGSGRHSSAPARRRR